MAVEVDFWRLAAGLGLFLFGMHQLEAALRLLAGRSFKQLLRRYTERPLRGVIAGAISTAALQSSSVVSLIVQAFTASNILSLASAVAIVYGANLGSTATGWIVATLGFRLNIETLALPLVAVGGLGIIWSSQVPRRFGICRLIIGLGLMLLGLAYMKDGAVGVASLFDPAALREYPPTVFLLVGLAITAVIQSSAATITITLSALYAGLIPLTSAAAVAIGADLGTNITAILGASSGAASKKRVAAAMVIFNVVTDMIAFTLLVPLLALITQLLGIDDPLYALVAFHSLFNLIGIVLFLPAIGLISRRLEGWFKASEASLLRYLKGGETKLSDVAIDNISRETYRLLDQTAAVNQVSFRLVPAPAFYEAGADRHAVYVFEGRPDVTRCYSELKQLEGGILSYALLLQREVLGSEESVRLSQLLSAIRESVYSAKRMRGILHDLQAFLDSVDDHFHAYYARYREMIQEFYSHLSELRNDQLPSMRFEHLAELKRYNESRHSEMHSAIYHDVTAGRLDEVEISTLLNVNRELYLSNESLLGAIGDTVLDRQMAADFDALPVSHEPVISGRD